MLIIDAIDDFYFFDDDVASITLIFLISIPRSRSSFAFLFRR